MTSKVKWWMNYFIHNCIVHPVMPFIPEKYAIQLHDWHGNITFNSKD